MEVKELSFGYGKKPVLKKISFSLQMGKITTIIGANGCGKSTLFHLMTRNLIPNVGKIILGNRNIRYVPLKEFAKKVAIVHQNHQVNMDMTVEQLISYGRIPHRRISCCEEKGDAERIDWAIQVTNLEQVRDRPIGKLSGGQRQRAFIAMALAQDTSILFLDEPTTYLDIRYQVEILELVKMLNREYGITIVMVLHDINQALHYADDLIGLKDGQIYVHGRPEEVITEESIAEIYGIKLPVTYLNGQPIVLAVGEEDKEKRYA